MTSPNSNSDSDAHKSEEPSLKSDAAAQEQPSLSLADNPGTSLNEEENTFQSSDQGSALTPLENASPEMPKRSNNEDVASSSSLSAPPSPVNTHRPTSSKTSVDDLPVTPLDAVDKSAAGSKDAEEVKEDKKETPKVNTERDPTPVIAQSPSKPPTTATRLPDNQVDAIIEINAELIRVYNEFHTQNQTQQLSAEFHQYYIRIQSNMHWLAQRSDQFAAQIPQSQRIHLPILSAPPVVPFTPCDRLQTIYAQLPGLFEKENAREQKKRQHRQLMLSGPPSISMAGLASTSSPVNVNINGKRERPEDDHISESGGQSPRKRIDTGESKLTPGLDGSPANLHGSPVRAVSSPMSGIARPSSSQSNHSSHAGSMPPPSSFPSTPANAPTPTNVDGMTPQDRMRMIQIQQSRMRAMSTGSAGGSAVGSPMSMNSSTVSSTLAQQNQGIAQAISGYNQPVNGAPTFQQSGPSPSPTVNRDGTINITAMLQNTNRPPANIYPSLVQMIQNPGGHQSVQTLMNKIPGWSGLRLEQQVHILWAFQSVQMRQSALAGMQGMMQQQQQQQQQAAPQLNGGYAAMGMRPPSSNGQQQPQQPQPGPMQPPPLPTNPSPSSMQLQNAMQHQQRQLALLKQQQQQQQAGMARQMNGMMGLNPNMGGGGGMMGGMGMGGNMMMGGHNRMPSNPSMAPPPVPLTASSPQSGYSSLSQGYGGGMNPVGMSYGGMGQPSQQMGGMGMQQQQSASQGMMMMTPSAMMQQAQAAAAAKMGGAGASQDGTMDPSAGISWQDLTAS